MGPDGESGLRLDLGALRPVEVAGLSIGVREWGDPAGRPLVFLHGLGPTQSSAMLGLVAAPLVAAGFHVVGIDQPGFGGSPTPPSTSGDAYDVTRLGALVWEVLDACSLGPSIVVGHSWGATIACEVAAARPTQVCALVLADSGHRDWADSAPDLLATPVEEIIRGGESIRVRATDRAAVAVYLDVTFDDPLVEVTLAALVGDNAGGLISRTTGEVLGNAQYQAIRARSSETWPVIAAADIPTLLLLATVPAAARDANKADRPRFAAAIPQAEIVAVEGASHQMITDLREGFGALVAAWLESTLP